MFDITYDLAFYDNDEHLRFGSLYMDAEKIVKMINWIVCRWREENNADLA